PSWFKRASVDIGKKGHGTMSADELRSAGLYSIPLTLILLWGNCAPESRQFRMLQNYLHLIEASDLILRRSTFGDRQSSIMLHLYRYIDGLHALYPNVSITPNQHLCFHIPRLLANIGPAWVISAWSTERSNQKLERVSTNNHIGVY
ncbi:hypothetical protein AURDEDRAFT_42438, partial [Auricularia subglabra TFB-10046 SS5]